MQQVGVSPLQTIRKSVGKTLEEVLESYSSARLKEKSCARRAAKNENSGKTPILQNNVCIMMSTNHRKLYKGWVWYYQTKISRESTEYLSSA